MAITNSYGTRIIKIYDSAKAASGSIGSDNTPIPNPANFVKNYGSPTTITLNTTIEVATATFETDLKNNLFSIGDTYYSPKNFAYATIIEVISQTKIKIDAPVAYTGSDVMIFKRNTSPCLLYVTNNSSSGVTSLLSIETKSGDQTVIDLPVEPTRQATEFIPLQVLYLKRLGLNLTGKVQAIFN